MFLHVHIYKYKNKYLTPLIPSYKTDHNLVRCIESSDEMAYSLNSLHYLSGLCVQLLKVNTASLCEMIL